MVNFSLIYYYVKNYYNENDKRNSLDEANKSLHNRIFCETSTVKLMTLTLKKVRNNKIVCLQGVRH